MTNEYLKAFIALGHIALQEDSGNADWDAYNMQCRTIAPELAKEVLKLREQLNRDSLAVICADALKDNERLREQLAIAVEALESIASIDRPRHSTVEYWLGISKERCADVLATDTKIARGTLKKIRGGG